MRSCILALAMALSPIACGDTNSPAAVADSEALSLEESAELTTQRLQALGEEFAVVEVAARVQDAFLVAPHEARLIISAADPGGVPVLDETFLLRPDRQIDSAFLQAETKPGFTMSTFSLAEEDAARILEVRQRLADLKAAAPGQNELNLNAYVTGCLQAGYETPDALRLTFFLRIRPEEDFFPLFNEMELPNTGQDFQSGFWTPCDEKRGT
ncbi:MAG: hypothetical protein AAFQ22_05415 [Pseudomonadota bacterium]